MVNESNLDVFFDDFTVQVLGTRAIRKTDYYPFGALAKQWNNPDQTQQEKYRHGYQGQFAEMDTTTGWNSFELRMYDPIIGRWLQVDPKRSGFTSYWGMDNNPVKLFDPDGGDPWLGETSTGRVTWVPNAKYDADPSQYSGWEVLSREWDFFGSEAYMTFLDRGFEPMSLEESISFMKGNGYKLAPMELIDQYTERNNIPHVNGPSVTIKDIIQVWTKMTYIPKSFDVSNYTLKVLDQEQGIANYSLIRSLNYSYERKSAFYWLLKGGKNLYETESDFTNKSVHYGWRNYPNDDSWLNTFRGF